MIAITIIKVREAIQEQVYGDVTVRVSSRDTLYVQINNNGSSWNWYIEELTEQLHAGVTSSQIAEWCMKAYKRHIWGIYLKNS